MKHRTRICALALCTALLGLCACKKEPQTRTTFALDTICTVTLYEPADGNLAERSLSLLDAKERQLSAHIGASEVARINAAGGRRVSVSKETGLLVALGIAYARDTNGLFDISIGPLSSLWDFHGAVVPGDEALQEAKAHVDASSVRVDFEGEQAWVQLPSAQARLDLGGVAKGWIADVMADDLRASGVKSAIINLGGNVIAIGSRTDGNSFAVGVQTPFAERNQIIGTLKVRDASVVTAGIYERKFESGGRIYHHILDPRTGYPVETDLLAATVITERSADGDALSTSCLLLGEKAALALLASKGAEAVLVRADGTICLTEGLQREGLFTPVVE